MSSVVEGSIDLPQPLGEGVRADELPALVGELDYSAFFDRMSISGGRHEADMRICPCAVGLGRVDAAVFQGHHLCVPRY